MRAPLPKNVMSETTDSNVHEDITNHLVVVYDRNLPQLSLQRKLNKAEVLNDKS